MRHEPRSKSACSAAATRFFRTRELEPDPKTRARSRIAIWLLVCLVGSEACGASQAGHAEPPGTLGAPSAKLDNQDFRRSPPTPQAEPAFSYPVPQLKKLKNGLDVYLLPRTTAYVAASLVVKRGALEDPEGQAGTAALTARMLTEGTLRRASLELTEATEDLGSEMVAQVTRDASVLNFQFLYKDLDQGLALMSEVLTVPSFSREAFARVKLEWIDALKDERQEPSSLARIVGMRASLPGKLGEPSDGSLSSVAHLNASDLSRFHARHYRPENTALFIAGPVTEAELDQVLGATLGSWQPSPTEALPERASEAPALTAASSAKTGRDRGQRFSRALVVDRPGSVQSAVLVTLPLPPRPQAGYEARALLNHVLGGMFTSRLNQNLREEHGFTYGARSINYTTQRFGLWLLETSVRSDVTVPALTQVLQEMRDIHASRPVTRDELTRATKELLGGYMESVEMSATLVDTVSHVFVDSLPADYFHQLSKLLHQIDATALREQAQTHLSGQPLLVIVGDRAHFVEALAPLVERVDVADPALLD